MLNVAVATTWYNTWLLTLSPAAAAWLGCWLAGRVGTHAGTVSKRLAFGEYVARGVFWALALSHLMPDAMRAGVASPTVMNSVVGSTIVVLVLFERFVQACASCHSAAESCLHMGLWGVVSSHALLAGMALGVRSAQGVVDHALLLGIVLHKVAASFALSALLRQQGGTATRHHRLMAGFIAMTPMGVLVGCGLRWLGHVDMLGGTGWVDAITAGTLLYMGTFNRLRLPQVSGTSEAALEGLGLLVGWVVMLCVMRVG